MRSQTILNLIPKKKIPRIKDNYFVYNRFGLPPGRRYYRYDEQAYHLYREYGGPLLRSCDIKNPVVKNVSFKSQIQKEPLLIAPETLIIKDVSLSTLSDSFRLKLEQDVVFSKLFVKFFLVEEAKILYYLFSQDFEERAFIHQIYKAFSLVKSKASCIDKNEADFYADKLISTIQHILNILCFNKTFDVKNLDLHENRLNIDFSLHGNKVPVSVIIEYFIAMKILLENESNTTIKTLNVSMINHKSPRLNDPTEPFKREGSLEQTGQIHSDFLLSRYLSNIEYTVDTVELLKIYRDVKADYRGPMTGHLTLKPFITTDLQSARIYINNYVSILTSFKKKNPLKENLIQKDISTLLILRDNLKLALSEANITAIMQKINALLLQLTLNPNYIKSGLNVTAAADVPYAEEFNKMLPTVKKNVEHYIENFPNSVDMNKVFPPSNKIDGVAYKKHIEAVIDNIIPEELKQQIHANYKKFIENGN